MIKNISLDRMREYSHCTDFVLKERLQPEYVYSYWMSLILIVSRSLRLTFKTHYLTTTASFLTHQLVKGGELVSQRQAIDFMKEYCNLTAGGIKRVLEFVGYPAGISLPVSCRGFDDIFYPKPSNSLGKEAAWDLIVGDKNVTCSVTVEIFDTTELAKIVDVKLDDPALFKSGSVEFL